MFSYNPYQSSYYSPYDNYYPSPSYAQTRALAQERAKAELRERSRALAAQQMMRDRYLVPEYEEDRNSSDEEYSGYGAGDYTPYGYAPGYGSSYDLSPRERAYLQAKYRDEREKKEILRRRLAQEELLRRQQAEEAFHTVSPFYMCSFCCVLIRPFRLDLLRRGSIPSRFAHHLRNLVLSIFHLRPILARPRLDVRPRLNNRAPLMWAQLPPSRS